MEVEKRGVKGGFFQLFDWNAKSRKKLFSTKSELPGKALSFAAESSNQGKENFHGSAVPRYHQGQENAFALGTRSHIDYYNYATSATSDSEYGTKAPGVVARLMGLDSLPTSAVNEPCFAPFIESHSFRDSSYSRVAPALQSEHDIVIFESVRNKLDGLSRNPLDLRLQKVQSRPIERFQREVLPPKSAKPIGITHNRLLSPIKSPGFIPPKNAAYIIEAAAKIMEQSPRSASKGKLPSIGSSSHSIRIRAMKEKMDAVQGSSRSADASQKGKEPSIKHTKKQLSGRVQSRTEESYLYKGAEELKRVSSQRSKSKEKSVSIAVQTKANIQKKDGFTSVSNRSSDRQRERNDITPSCVSKSGPNSQNKMERVSSSRRTSEVLRLNHQKQNCATSKSRENCEPSNSKYKDGKESNLSNSCVNGKANKIVNKIVINSVVTSRKTNPMAPDPGKELSSSRTKTISKKKLAIDENIQNDGNVSQKAAMVKDERSVKCNIAFEGNSSCGTIDKKNNLDVVSFTFTSPIKKSGAGPNSSGTILDISGSSFSNCDPCGSESDLTNSAASSSGYNFAGGDSLSLLLEQKLKELTSKVELSLQEPSEGTFSISSNSHGNRGPTVNLVNPLPVNDDIHKGKQEIQNYLNFSSTDKLWLRAEKENKELEYIEKVGNNSNVEFRRYLHFQGTSSVSSLPSFSGASSDSVEVDRKSNGSSTQDLSPESYEGMTQSSARKSCRSEADMEISDTASSLSVGTITETVSSRLYNMTDSKDSLYWQLQYIGDILNCRELMLEEFALGEAHKIVAPDIFEQVENHIMASNKAMEDHLILERKVLFDCVCECLELRSGRLLAGSCMFWAKQWTLLCKKQWLAEELYREISNWTNAEELMVDELVDKDMSSKNGKWIDFEVEAFEESVEIEERVLTSLIDELIDDFLL